MPCSGPKLSQEELATDRREVTMAQAEDLARAQEAYRQGDPDTAADILERYVELEPTDMAARLLLARCYSRMRMSDEAIIELEDVLKLEPKNSEAHALRGAEHYFADELDEALQELERAIELDPDNVEARVRLAQVHTDLKQDEEAEAALAEAEARAGQDEDKLALVRMGQVYLAMQRRQNDRVQELIAENEHLWQGRPYVASTIRSNEAILYARRRDYARARDLLVDALDLDPWFHTARSLLGQIAVIQRDYALAADQLAQVVENSDDVGPHVYYALATSLAALNRQDEAVPYYAAALERGLRGFPALTARLAVWFPDPRLRLALLVVLLLALGYLAFSTFEPFIALAVVAFVGVLGWQIVRGGR
jgi:tetratricopeptide (TPR) repeat protein